MPGMWEVKKEGTEARRHGGTKGEDNSEPGTRDSALSIALVTAWDEAHGVPGTVEQIAALDITVAELNRLYVQFRDKYKPEKDKAEDLGRAWLKRLENNDPIATALWKRFREVSWGEFEDVYKLLGVAYEDLNGESTFWKQSEQAVEDLRAKGLLVESEGAQVVFHDGEKQPFIVLTRDGTTLYGTRDLVAAQYRWDTYHFDRSLYVVDRGQSLHFKLLFKTLEKMNS